MYMVLLVLDDPARMDEVLAAWETAGVSGVTLLESSGAFRRRRELQQRIPARYAFGYRQDVAASHVTLFSIVPTLTVAEACAAATASVVGDLDRPHTGVFACWPLTMVKGVPEIPPQRDG